MGDERAAQTCWPNREDVTQGATYVLRLLKYTTLLATVVCLLGVLPLTLCADWAASRSGMETLVLAKPPDLGSHHITFMAAVNLIIGLFSVGSSAAAVMCWQGSANAVQVVSASAVFMLTMMGFLLNAQVELVKERLTELSWTHVCAYFVWLAFLPAILAAVSPIRWWRAAISWGLSMSFFTVSIFYAMRYYLQIVFEKPLPLVQLVLVAVSISSARSVLTHVLVSGVLAQRRPTREFLSCVVIGPLTSLLSASSMLALHIDDFKSVLIFHIFLGACEVHRSSILLQGRTELQSIAEGLRRCTSGVLARWISERSHPRILLTSAGVGSAVSCPHSGLSIGGFADCESMVCDASMTSGALSIAEVPSLNSYDLSRSGRKPSCSTVLSASVSYAQAAMVPSPTVNGSRARVSPLVLGANQAEPCPQGGSTTRGGGDLDSMRCDVSMRSGGLGIADAPPVDSFDLSRSGRKPSCSIVPCAPVSDTQAAAPARLLFSNSHGRGSPTSPGTDRAELRPRSGSKSPRGADRDSMECDASMRSAGLSVAAVPSASSCDVTPSGRTPSRCDLPSASVGETQSSAPSRWIFHKSDARVSPISTSVGKAEVCEQDGSNSRGIADRCSMACDASMRSGGLSVAAVPSASSGEVPRSGRKPSQCIAPSASVCDVQTPERSCGSSTRGPPALNFLRNMRGDSRMVDYGTSEDAILEAELLRKLALPEVVAFSNLVELVTTVSAAFAMCIGKVALLGDHGPVEIPRIAAITLFLLAFELATDFFAAVNINKACRQCQGARYSIPYHRSAFSSSWQGRLVVAFIVTFGVLVSISEMLQHVCVHTSPDGRVLWRGGYSCAIERP